MKGNPSLVAATQTCYSARSVQSRSISHSEADKRLPNQNAQNFSTSFQGKDGQSVAPGRKKGNDYNNYKVKLEQAKNLRKDLRESMKATELTVEDINNPVDTKSNFTGSYSKPQQQSRSQQGKNSTSSYCERFSKPLAASSLFPTPDLFPILDIPMESLEESSESKGSREPRQAQDDDCSEDTQSLTYTVTEDNKSINLGDTREYYTEKKRPGKKNSSSSELGFAGESRHEKAVLLGQKGCPSPGLAGKRSSKPGMQASFNTNLKLFEQSASQDVEADMQSCLSNLQMLLQQDQTAKQSLITYPDMKSLLTDPNFGVNSLHPNTVSRSLLQNKSLAQGALTKKHETLALKMMKTRKHSD